MSMLVAGKRLVGANAAHQVGVRAVLGASSTQIQARTFYGVYEKYMEAYKRFGWKLSLWKLYNPGDIKFGKFMGEDKFGNKYYEDPTEVHGQHRYTEYKVDSYDDFDGSMVPPEWHLWLSHFTDAVPGSPEQDPANWKKVPIVEESHAPYTSHVGPRAEYHKAMSFSRSRGYGVGSTATAPDEPDQFYVQPGHLLRRRQRKNDFFDDVDYNNPNASAKNSSEMLRPLDVN